MGASIDIRNATSADAATIAGFNARLARETEAHELDSTVLKSGVEALIADPSKGRYWVAEVNAAIVGQIMITFEWSDWRNGTIWWIQSVYVSEDHRRKGVFRALYEHVESLAKAAPDVCGLRLYVDHSNDSARQTYRSLGMAESGYRVLQTMFDENRRKNKE